MGQKRTWTATAFRLAVVSVKRVVRTYRHIKTGWCSARRVAHLGVAAARNRHAADDGASNLWLCSTGSLRVTLLVRGRRAGRHQRKRKHNGRTNGYDCFQRDPLSISARQAVNVGAFPSHVNGAHSILVNPNPPMGSMHNEFAQEKTGLRERYGRGYRVAKYRGCAAGPR